jgi:uncharacterized repeat protein (TIGR01451 family)
MKCHIAAASLTAAPMRDFNYGKTCSYVIRLLRKLFDVTAEYANQLDNGVLPQAMRDQFVQNGYELTEDAHVQEIREPGDEWLIASSTDYYVLRRGCLWGECLFVYLLTSVNEDADEVWQTPTSEGFWMGCRPQWKNGEAIVPANSVTGVGWCGDVGALTATFPWRADAVPFPHSANVDGEFCRNHLASNSAPEIYTYVLDRLASTVQPSSAQAAASSQVEPEPLAQPLFSVSGILAPGAAPTFTVPIENVFTATFHVFASPHVSVTLLTPNNELVDPSTPLTNPQITYTVQPGDEFTFYQYRVDAPADGVWQVQLQASETVTYGLSAAIVSPVSLVAERGESLYRPGETIHLYAAAVDEHVLQAGFTVTGTAALVDGTTFALDFYDDGTHGDITANNGIHTAQLTAPAFTASLAVTVQPSTDAARLGDAVTYTYIVQNTGDVTLDGATLTDSRLGALALSSTTLQPGGVAVASAVYTVTAANLPGPLTNRATVNATAIGANTPGQRDDRRCGGAQLSRRTGHRQPRDAAAGQRR